MNEARHDEYRVLADQVPLITTPSSRLVAALLRVVERLIEQLVEQVSGRVQLGARRVGPGHASELQNDQRISLGHVAARGVAHQARPFLATLPLAQVEVPTRE